MSKEKDLITLKEASQISGYAPDYIGQLIRAGKISGQQVYTNISWMTTPEAVLNYKNKAKNNDNFKEQFLRRKRIFTMQYNIIKLILHNFPSLKPTLAILLLSFIFLCAILLYNAINSHKFQTTSNHTDTKQNLNF
jgi:hypothetical protein